MARIDRTIYRGDDHDFNFDFKDGDGVAIDITGWTIFFTIKSAVDDLTADTSAVLTKEQTSHTNPTGGLTTLSLADTDTNDLDDEEYWYDFQYKNSSGKIKTIMHGIMTVVREVTRRIT